MLDLKSGHEFKLIPSDVANFNSCLIAISEIKKVRGKKPALKECISTLTKLYQQYIDDCTQGDDLTTLPQIGSLIHFWQAESKSKLEEITSKPLFRERALEWLDEKIVLLEGTEQLVSKAKEPAITFLESWSELIEMYGGHHR